MPGPFPGMDPYLENPEGWPSVHHLLITYLGTTLNSLLPPRYVANIGERLYVLHHERSIVPDVTVKERLQPAGGEARGTAAMLVSDPPWEVDLGPEEIREGFIEIIPVAEPGRVITLIEVLSPTNKAHGTEGRLLYQQKQEEVLAGTTHLLEVDLLRYGEHTVAAPLDRLLRRGRWDYLVSLNRGDRLQAWPVTLRQRLPRFHVPLTGDDPDVVLDLQTLIDRCYDEGAFTRRVDYRRDPVVPLAPDDAAWADALLRERGLRS